MTRIKVGASTLRRLIQAHDPTWLKRAREQTKFVDQKSENDAFPPLWSQIKEVYVQVQGGEKGGKCAYCEKWLEADRIEHDVEHFRPKASVARWDVPAHLREELRAAGFRVNQPHRGSEPGYRLLAYHILNYATVCKECNSVLKRNLFPITGKRRSDARAPTRLASEGALLIYPLGSHDTDPEDLIEFCGASPQARAVSGHGRLRALVTIDFFRLDDWRGRRSLILDRMEWVEKLLWALQRRDRGQDAPNARKAIERLTSTAFRHANCLRSFRRLYEKNPGEAEKLYEEKIRSLLESYSSEKRPS